MIELVKNFEYCQNCGDTTHGAQVKLDSNGKGRYRNSIQLCNGCLEALKDAIEEGTQ